MPLRVLLAVHHFPPQRIGGAELIALRIARWLQAHGHFVRVVCIGSLRAGTQDDLSWQDDEYQGVAVRRYDLSLSQRTARLHFENALLEQNLRALVETFSADVVHVISGYLMGTAPLNVAFTHRIPSVVTLTDFWFLCPTLQLLRGDGTLCWGPEPVECVRCIADERRPFRLLDENVPRVAQGFWRTAAAHPRLGTRFDVPNTLSTLRERQRICIETLNRANALAPLTHWVVEMHRRNGLSDALPVHKLDFFDLDDFEPAAPLPRARAEIRFGYLGQIAPIKGVDVLLRAFQKLNATYRGDKRFSLTVHGNLNATERYAQQLKRLAHAPNVFLRGAYAHQDTLRLLNEMDVVVVPSIWHENVPRVIFEAFAAKRPVLGSRIGGITEVVTDEYDGLLFERGDVNDLLRVMRRVLDEPNLLPRLAEHTQPPRAFQEDMEELVQLYHQVRASQKTHVEHV
jgi:glycosyltransferase involved in cell wall biosynthesis